MSEPVSQDVVFDGGSEADRRRVLAAHEAYLDANAGFAWQRLQELWSHDPGSVFFNLNGHTYVGLDQWTRLWQYYAGRLETGRWEPFDLKVVIRGDLALVTCHRRTRLRWSGPPAERPPAGHEDREFVSRSTMALLREGAEWRTIHVHFSPASDGPRPGGV